MSKTVNGKTTQFIWDGMNMIVEFSSTDGDIAAYIYGPSGLLARNSSQGGLLIYTTNAHGDVTAATKQLGGTVMEYYYDAYGNVIHATNVIHTATLADNPFLYCGEYTDFETGFIYLRNRYYDPEQRRFITEDPIHDGSNWYVYCGNNPVMYVDSNGLSYINGVWHNDVFYYLKDGTCHGYIVGEMLTGDILTIRNIDGNVFDINIYNIDHQISILEDGTQYYYGDDGIYTLDGSDQITKGNKEYRPGTNTNAFIEDGALPLTGEPNTTVTKYGKNGAPVQRRTYGPDGKAAEDEDLTDHGNPKQHPNVPHKHPWTWNGDNPSRGKEMTQNDLNHFAYELNNAVTKAMFGLFLPMPIKIG